MARPVAIAPEPGGVQVIGDVSGAAEAFGVVAGMRLGEALGRCPALALVPADPQRAEEAWEGSLATLEGIGAAVESQRPGRGVLRPRRPAGALGAARAGGRAGAASARPGRSPGRRAHAPRGAGGGASLAAAARQGGGDGLRAGGARLPRPARGRRSCATGWATSGPASTSWTRWSALAWRRSATSPRCPTPRVADRFGEPGLRALGMARGVEAPLRPRQPRAELREEIELHDAATAGQLDRALELLVDRLLANPLRRGRSFRRLRIEARLAGGGGWRIEAPTRHATADRERLLLVLGPKLAALPAPATHLALRGLELGEAAPRQPTLYEDDAEERRAPRSRGGAPRARRRRPRRRPARARGGPGRRRARALGDAHAVPGGRRRAIASGRRRMTVLLYEPKRVAVRADAHGRPVAVEGADVETVREEWLVEDRWWTPEPIRRHYFELALADGRCEVVFRDAKGWFSQRA